MEVMSHFNMAESRSRVLSQRPLAGLQERAPSELFKLEDGDNRLAAISTGRTSCLPLIVLPKKKVDFNPTRSIIQPLSIHDELWCNLNAEITRRKSTSSVGAPDTTADSPTATIAPSMAGQQSGRMIRLQRRFQKALTRLRKVFHHQPEVDKKKTEWASPEPVRRTLVRRDSNVSNAKRLAAKRKRPSLTANESIEADGWIRKFQSLNTSLTQEPETSEITSELQEIFEHLTVSVSKRPRLDSNNTITCRICTC